MNIQRAEALMQEGRKALRFKDYEEAYVKFLDAVELLPPGEAGGNRRGPAVAEFSSVALRYAEWLIEQGRFDEAEQVAKTILLPEFNPTYRPAVRLLSNLEQPDVFNKTVTPQFAGQREDVNRLFREAEGFYSAGRFDLATKRYNQILAIDPYNSAARQGMERVDLERQKYYGSAYNETRSRMLWEVTQAWETPVPRGTMRDDTIGGFVSDIRGTEAIQAKLNRIIIPRINLQDTTLREAVSFLQQQSIRLDTTAADDDKRGVNIVLRLDQPGGEPDPGAPSPNTRISLALNQVPLFEALRYVAELSGLRVKVEPFAVTLVPLSVPIDSLVTKEYRVPPGFIPPTPPDEATQGFTPRGQVATRGPAITNRINAQKFLEESGVTFPPGASASFIPTGSKLIVRNTPDNIELIDNLVNATVGVAPTQVEIEAKFLEVSQNDLAELGFDWLLGPVSLGGGVYAGGGDTRLNPVNYPFPTTDQFSLTRGLRSGSGANPQAAVTTNSIDALLGGAVTDGVAPSILGISGIFTNPQFQVLIRALDQKKGIDVLSAPKVTTKSGQRSEIRIVRKFFYPTVFDPPTIPDTTGTTGTGGGTVVINPLFRTPPTVTPAFPSNFEERDIGVILNVLPTIGPDTYTIDLSLTPEVVDFDGFINYGSPINTVGYAFNALEGIYSPQAIALTENVINQPVFSVRRVETEVTIWDGQTVALGGLMREDVQKVQDKVPIIGDIPLAGRLFRSNVDQKIKRNLIIFVSANIIDAEGRPLRRDDEVEDDIVEPLGLPEQLAGPQFPTFKGGGIRMK
jgi:general secretion pathway protein D